MLSIRPKEVAIMHRLFRCLSIHSSVRNLFRRNGEARVPG